MARILMRPKDTAKLSARFRSMARQLPNTVKRGLADAADDASKDFEATWDTWDHKPAVVIEERDSGNGYDITVDDEVWNMLNHGTRPHSIDGDPLAFFSEHVAKTRAGWVGSQAGGSSGDRVYATHVDHPGTAPRRWDKAIQEKWRPKVAKYVRDALKEGVEAIGL